ncbi:MAG: amidohydrolase [Treponema sp.]|jgi:hippurate hydrolase|nr:amidohydrolase [Treponema sp.]
MHNVVQEAQALQEELVTIRRYLHVHPEIDMELPQTVAFVKGKLEEMGYEPKVVGPSGLSVMVGGKNPGKCFLIRADMDALPISEAADDGCRSTNGCMHACGHDFHTTMLLGAAKLLKAHEDAIQGSVKLMFQPGEETIHGAKSMVEHGILDNPPVDAAAMFHVAVGMPFPSGTILVPGGGAYSSASDHFEVTIQGKGGHGAMPEHCVDPLLVASHLYLALQTIISREIAPADTGVISIGIIKAGEANNIIPDTAYMKGTIRTYDPEVREFILERVKAVSTGTAETFRAKADPHIIEGCPAVVIDDQVAADIRATLAAAFGKAVINPTELGMPRFGGSEDFSFITQQVPSVMMMLSVGSPDEGYPYSMHHPKAIFNETVLSQGAAAYAMAAMGWLAKNH